MRCVVITVFCTTLAAAEPGPSALGTGTLSLHILPEAGKPDGRVQLKLTEVPAPQTLELNSRAGEKLRPDEPLKILAVALPEPAQAVCVTFGTDLADGSSRSIAVLLLKPAVNSSWMVAQEWATESKALGELGVSRVKQKFSSDKLGTFKREVSTFKIEGFWEKLDCGCNQCLSRTTDLRESETYTWGGAGFTQTAYEKYYIIQPGEGLMSVARKALGDARLIARIIRLNPELNAQQVIKEGQQVLVERKPK